MKKEISRLKNEQNDMKNQLLLLRNYFFKHWNEKIQYEIHQDIDFRTELCNDASKLYYKVEAVGLHFEEYGSIRNCLHISRKGVNETAVQNNEMPVHINEKIVQVNDKDDTSCEKENNYQNDAIMDKIIEKLDIK